MFPISRPSPRPVTAIERKYLRKMKRELKARAYRAVALAGGGKREVERRAPRAFNQFYWDAKRVMV